MTKVISMKDWVPSRVRDSYTTNEEIDALNEEYEQYQSFARASYLTAEEIDALNQEYEQSTSRCLNTTSASVNHNTLAPNNEKLITPG
ncbi:hypothetical protein QUA07_16620 [Microcoleus sp. T3_A4]|uniref:hypothetical protein n=1 Tax=Microcoleus sp. T3_A4 TaxID=2818968 RepID=UPI002FD18B49